MQSSYTTLNFPVKSLQHNLIIISSGCTGIDVSLHTTCRPQYRYVVDIEKNKCLANENVRKTQFLYSNIKRETSK